MSRFKYRPIALSLLALHSAPLLAEEVVEPETPAPVAAPLVAPQIEVTSGTTKNAQELEEVTVRAAAESPYKANALSSPKFTEPLRDTPKTVVVLPEQVYKDQGVTSLRDVLRNTPGITMQAGEGGTAAGDNIFIRGFNASDVIYIDGARDGGAYSRDSFNMESVEISKGASSSAGGRSSAGGSVNTVAKKARLDDFNNLRLTGGNAEYMRATLDTNHIIDDTTAIRVNGVWMDAGVPGRDEAYNKTWGGAIDMGFGLGTDTEVHLSYQRLTQDNMPDMGFAVGMPASVPNATIKDINWSNFYGVTARDYEYIDSDIFTAVFSRKINESVSLRNLTRYGRTTRDAVYTPPRAASAAGTGYNASLPQIGMHDFKAQDREYGIFVNQTDVNWSFKTGFIEHEAVTGLEYSRERQDSYSKAFTPDPTYGIPVTDLYNPDPNRPLGNFSVYRTGAKSETEGTTVALYAFDTLKFGEQWQLSGGIRHETLNANTYNLSVNTTTNVVTVSSFRSEDSMTSYHAGLAYKPVEEGTVYIARSNSYTPSAAGAWSLGVTGSTQKLEPQESINNEAGVKWDVISKRLSVTSALFQTKKDNILAWDTTGSVAYNSGSQEVRGIEIGAAGSITDDWAITAGYAWMDSSATTINNTGVVTANDQQLQFLPKTSFTLWSTYKILPLLTAGAGVQHADGIFHNNNGAAGLSTPNRKAINDLTSYWLVNAMASYELNKMVTLQLNVNNLTDEKYIDRATGGHVIPGAGRAILASVDVSF